MVPAGLAAPLLLPLALQLFGGSQAAGASMRGAAQEEPSILGLVEAELGAEWRRATEALVDNTSGLWQAMYRTLPKNRQGRVDAAAAGYALNRFFLQRYRWRVQGLASTGTAWGDDTSPLVVEGRMPRRVRGYFQDRVFGRGVAQQDLAVLAATIELFIRDDAREQLRSAYEVLLLDPEGEITSGGARDVVTLYSTCYSAGVNVSKVTPTGWRRWREAEDNLTTTGPNVDSWIAASPYPSLESFSFAQVQAIIQVFQESHLQYVHDMWSQMKERLMTFQGSASGRISLADFYTSFEEKGWTSFDERKEFMQQLGVLDESDAAQTRVIIPNYLLNPLNCAGPWGYYATCSINECEFLMSNLERSLGSPEAAPGVIAEAVANLPSATVKAPRTLSGALVRKLEEVAEHHKGTVPIHGRLFFQWMHFAYPLECPYPFPSDTVRPMSETEFKAETGLEPYYDANEIKDVIRSASTTPPPHLDCDENADECLAMWTPIEELVQHRRVPLDPRSGTAAGEVAAAAAASGGGGGGEEEETRAPPSSLLASALRFAALAATVPALLQAVRQMASASDLARQLLSGRAAGEKQRPLP